MNGQSRASVKALMMGGGYYGKTDRLTILAFVESYH